MSIGPVKRRGPDARHRKSFLGTPENPKKNRGLRILSSARSILSEHEARDFMGCLRPSEKKKGFLRGLPKPKPQDRTIKKLNRRDKHDRTRAAQRVVRARRRERNPVTSLALPEKYFSCGMVGRLFQALRGKHGTHRKIVRDGTQ